MDEQYIFILWNKALFCQKHIVKDLSSSFSIEKIFYNKWSKNDFHNNMMSLYGTKAPNIENKIKAIGTDEFCIIVIKDCNPKFEKRSTYNGMEEVNSSVYDKKWLYRKWTGGQFRIHCTQTKVETAHDLTIMFGINYKEELNKINNYDHTNIDLFDSTNYNSFDDFSKTINNIGTNIAYKKENKIYIFSKCSTDLKFFLKNSSQIIINKCIFDLTIYGENEGDLPINFISKLNDNLILDFFNIENDYQCFLNNRNYITKQLKGFYNKHHLKLNKTQINTMRPYYKTTYIKRLKNTIKYIYYKYIYINRLEDQKD